MQNHEEQGAKPDRLETEHRDLLQAKVFEHFFPEANPDTNSTPEQLDWLIKNSARISDIVDSGDSAVSARIRELSRAGDYRGAAELLIALLAT